MRINQYLAAHTGMSRRQADAAIQAGRVLVDGQPAQLGHIVREHESISLDSRPVIPQPSITIALNKPRGYICSRRHQGNAPTIFDLLPPELHSLKTVGRLDKDSSGLLLLTSDGQLAQRLTHPSYQKEKRYQVLLDRALDARDQEKLRKGVELSDGPSRLRLDGANKRWLVRLSEGRNRQIRRTFAALNYDVKELHRLQIGNLQLKRLALEPGQYARITAGEAV